MSGTITRRDLLKLAGGSMLGLLCTPVPWKLLDDSAIWTQNWAIIPKLKRGPIRYAFSTCTLCSGGCPIKARCVGANPVSLTGVPNHPIGHGVLCPAGLCGHTVAFHPRRIDGPVKFTGKSPDSSLHPISLEQAVAEIAASVSGKETIAVLDQRPGRAISEVYENILKTLPGGVYLPATDEETTLSVLAELTASTPGRLGFDLEHTSTILSFGAPLVDGWGTPGRVANMLVNRAENGLKLIHFDCSQSRTSLQADTWLPLVPGGETACALGIAHVILQEGKFVPGLNHTATDFAAYRELVSEFTPAAVSDITGVNAEDIVRTAHEFAIGTPAVAIAGCDPASGPLEPAARVAVAGLNLLIGSIGRTGGILLRHPTPYHVSTQRRTLTDIPDGSIKVLIIDDAESGSVIPWQLIQRKLVPENSVVVSLSPLVSGLTAHADYIIPSPAHLESLQDVPTAPGARCASLSLSPPLHPERKGTVDQSVFIKALADARGFHAAVPGTVTDIRKQRVAAIFNAGRGCVFAAREGSAKRISDYESPDEVWNALIDGDCWIDDDHPSAASSNFSLTGGTAIVQQMKAVLHLQRPRLLLVAAGWRNALHEDHSSPVMTKLFQESELRPSGGEAFINPRTCVALSLVDGGRARVQTRHGSMDVRVHREEGVVPDVVQVTIGPDPLGTPPGESRQTGGVLSLCDVREDGTWKATEATVEGII